MSFIIIKTTVADKENAEKLAKLLILNKIAACVSIHQIESFYNWNNSLECDKEFEISIKTKKINYKIAEEFILKNHSYEVPQIISFDITEGYERYLKWISEETEINNN